MRKQQIVFAVHININAADDTGVFGANTFFNMHEVIMHTQPSSGTMRLIFGPCVRPNAACISRLLHIVFLIDSLRPINNLSAKQGRVFLG